MKFDLKLIDYVIIEEGQTELKNKQTLYVYRGSLLILSDNNISLYKHNGMMRIFDIEFSNSELEELIPLAVTLEEMRVDLPKKIMQYTKTLTDLPL